MRAGGLDCGLTMPARSGGQRNRQQSKQEAPKHGRRQSTGSTRLRNRQKITRKPQEAGAAEDNRQRNAKQAAAETRENAACLYAAHRLYTIHEANRMRLGQETKQARLPPRLSPLLQHIKCASDKAQRKLWLYTRRSLYLEAPRQSPACKRLHDYPRLSLYLKKQDSVRAFCKSICTMPLSFHYFCPGPGLSGIFTNA